MHKFFFTISFFAFLFAVKAQTLIKLDEDWRFHFGHAANPEKDFNYSINTIFAKSGGAWNTAIEPRFDDANWRKLDLPHDWAVELPFVNHVSKDVESHGFKPVGGYFPETSIGWYRKRFKVMPQDSGQRFQLRFDGIFRNATIWVNGFYVGTNHSGYVGVNYDVTDIINFDKDNVIVVRVDATQYEGWFYEGAGIYRHVWLQRSDNVHIPDGGLFFYTDVKNQEANVTIETTVKNQNYDAVDCSVQTFIMERNGTIIAQTEVQNLNIFASEQSKIKQNLSLKNPHLWQLEDPYLYKIKCIIKQNGKIIDQKEDRLGVRTLRFDANEGFFLNEKSLKIYGTNNHQDHAGLGAALPDYLQYYRIERLKKMGVNAYRTSHNAPTKELLDACDSLGMLVMDEQRLLNSSDEYLNQLERLVLRDRNHPSVFMWSIGNEEGWIHTTSHGKRIALTFLEKLKKLDPTRTTTYAADVANVFQGVNSVIPIRSFNYRQFGVADYHRDHPTQPCLGTEMGSTVTTRGIYEKDTVRCYLPDHDITAPWWASTAETWWKLAAENKYWLGGFIWTGFDYRGEPTPFGWPNINSHFGVMDVCGFPKNLYYYYQSWWTDKDILNVSPHWNWQKGETIDVWVNSNADDVELFLNGKTLGKKTMPRNGHLVWKVAYEPGKLSAIAYKKGKKLSAQVETTGVPAKIVLSGEKKTLLANGEDAAVFNVSVVDAQGREVPDANNMIHFSIDAAAKIIGVGNGDPSCHEPDKCPEGAWQRSAFSGKCQVIIQAKKIKGNVKLVAKSAGIGSSAVEMEVKVK